MVLRKHLFVARFVSPCSLFKSGFVCMLSHASVLRYQLLVVCFCLGVDDSFWYRSPVGLRAGDNTLNVLCSLRAARTLTHGRFGDVSQPDARAAVLSDYVHFLTTPGSHADTYAESFHRSFFADWRDSRPTSPREVKQALPIQPLATRRHECPCLLDFPPSPGSDLRGGAFQTDAELSVS